MTLSFRAVATGLVLAIAAGLAGCERITDDRMWVDTQVNGKSMHMFVDTGSTISSLDRSVAEDLGLKISEPPKNALVPFGKVALGITTPCDFTLWGSTTKTQFGVVDLPEYVRLDVDGVVGWSEVHSRLLVFDALAKEIRPLDKLPDDIATWTKFRLHVRRDFLSRTDRWDFMTLEVPQGLGPPGLIYVDTGNSAGVGMSPEHWYTWRTSHPNDPATLRLYYTPSTGVVIGEEMWARKFSLGPLAITEVPVGVADPATLQMGGAQHIATIGMAALRRLDFILDGPQNVVYLRPKNTPPVPYNHNRLGAVFVLLDYDSDFLSAQVEPGSPAFLAGLRDGDIITYINGRTSLNWQKYPSVGIPNFDWEAGDKVYLRASRDGEEHRINVRLRDIIGPGSPEYEASLAKDAATAATK